MLEGTKVLLNCGFVGYYVNSREYYEETYPDLTGPAVFVGNCFYWVMEGDLVARTYLQAPEGSWKLFKSLKKGDYSGNTIRRESKPSC